MSECQSAADIMSVGGQFFLSKLGSTLHSGVVVLSFLLNSRCGGVKTKIVLHDSIRKTINLGRCQKACVVYVS